MPKQNIKALRDYQSWRRGADIPMPHPVELGHLIDWAIAVCEAAENLVSVKGRHHSEQAYQRLEKAVRGEK